jgi:hypothetical protein
LINNKKLKSFVNINKKEENFMKVLKYIINTLFILSFLTAVGHTINIGLGWTLDTGVHIRLGMFELQSVFGSDVSIYGLRLYPINKELSIMKKVFNFYSGIETDYVYSDVLDWGYTAGVFTGLDKAIFKNLHLSLDLGVFFSTVKGFEEFSDWGSAINTKLTWYIGGKK